MKSARLLGTFAQYDLMELAVQHTTTVQGQPEGPIPYAEVQGLALDDVLAINGIERCDFLKMGCEGCEFEVLFGASPATLERISRICLEYHDGSPGSPIPT